MAAAGAETGGGHAHSHHNQAEAAATEASATEADADADDANDGAGAGNHQERAPKLRVGFVLRATRRRRSPPPAARTGAGGEGQTAAQWKELEPRGAATAARGTPAPAAAGRRAGLTVRRSGLARGGWAPFRERGSLRVPTRGFCRVPGHMA